MNAQDFIVFMLVAGAIAYLVRNWWGASRKSGGGCSGCAGACGKPTAKPEPQLVQISLNGASFKGASLHSPALKGAALNGSALNGSTPRADASTPRPKA